MKQRLRKRSAFDRDTNKNLFINRGGNSFNDFQ